MRNIILLLMLCSGMAWGQQGEWSYAGPTGDGDSAFVQLHNIQKVGPYYRAWTKLVDSTGARTLSYCEFDLKQYRMRELQMIEYDAHGKTLNNGPSGDTWTYYPPDSFPRHWIAMITSWVNKKTHD